MPLFQNGGGKSPCLQGGGNVGYFDEVLLTLINFEISSSARGQLYPGPTYALCDQHQKRDCIDFPKLSAVINNQSDWLLNPALECTI